jgi:hypothetical protein
MFPSIENCTEGDLALALDNPYDSKFLILSPSSKRTLKQKKVIIKYIYSIQFLMNFEFFMGIAVL